MCAAAPRRSHRSTSRCTRCRRIVGQFGVAQQLFSQSMQADANGHFEFSFTSPFPVPGTRYDVSMVASKDDVTGEARLVLYQRQG